MAFNPDIHHRRSIRLRDYDYSRVGVYFVTICAFQRECLFGEIVGGEMQLNRYGAVVREEWLLTGRLRDYVSLDEYIIMPNHFHAILTIDERKGTACRAHGSDLTGIMEQGTARRAPTAESFGRPVADSLPTIIRSFNPPPQNVSTPCAITLARRFGNGIFTNGSFVTTGNWTASGDISSAILCVGKKMKIIRGHEW